jgi:hypothetical protein
MSAMKEMTQEEFDDLANEIVALFSARQLTARDGVTILMMIAIRSCLVNAPSLSVAISEVTKAFVMGLSPDVIAANDRDINEFLTQNTEDNEYWMLPPDFDTGEDQDDREV